MVVESRWAMPISETSIHQWIFGAPHQRVEKGDALSHVDADRPDTHFLTFNDYRLLSKRIGLGLQQAGLQSGDRVLVFSGNHVYYPSLFCGVLMAGGVFSGANPGFVARELAYQLRDSGSTFLFAARESLDVALQAIDEAGLAKDRLYIFDAEHDPRPNKPAPASRGRQQGVRHWTELIQSDIVEAEAWSWVEPTDPKNTTCCLNYSSGTTGVPKGVEISHQAYVANCSQVIFLSELDPEYGPKHERARCLAFLPFYHAYGQTYFIANCPAQRVPVYVMPKFDFLKFLQHIEKFRITVLTCVPPIIVALAKHPAARKANLSSVETVGSGAAPLAADIAKECEDLFKSNGVIVSQGWGMTEVTCTCMMWEHSRLKHSGGVGELMPNCAGKIMDMSGETEIVEPHKTGELWVTGPNLMRGYWNKPDATSVTLVTDSDGRRWLRTGDIAYVEEYQSGGIWHIVDRIKELIKVKGNQVAPAELEGILLDHPAISDAAVVGVTIQAEEYPRAYIQLSPGAKVTEKEIADWMADKVTRYKQLRGGVVFIDAVPKNPSGKILRKILRDKAQQEVGDRAPFPAKI